MPQIVDKQTFLYKCLTSQLGRPSPFVTLLGENLRIFVTSIGFGRWIWLPGAKKSQRFALSKSAHDSLTLLVAESVPKRTSSQWRLSFLYWMTPLLLLLQTGERPLFPTT